MKKLIRGIVDFRKKILPGYAEMFANLALGQKPDVLFIACSDSRVVPNLFASTDPGDLFVVRNVGNMIPPCGTAGTSESDESELAAIEFALLSLNVADIVVCGHSECGAMKAITEGRERIQAPHLKNWLRYGEPSKERLHQIPRKHWHLPEHNELSQKNVLQQLDHLRSYPIVQQKIQEGKLSLHGWWFNISEASVYAYDPEKEKFILIDEKVANRLLQKMEQPVEG